MIEVIEYNESYADQVAKLFVDFQEYIATTDPLKRLTSLDFRGGIEIVEKWTKEIKEKDGIWYVAIENENIIGFIIAVVEELTDYDRLGLIPSAKPGRIEELYIDAAYRGKGLGTQLMQKAEAYLKNKGCEVVKVGVFASNTLARNLYQKLGYQERDIDNIKTL